MKRPLRPEDARLWALVAATVRPSRARPQFRSAPAPASAAELSAPARAQHIDSSRPAGSPPLHSCAGHPARHPQPARAASPGPVEGIEPNRRRRIAQGRDPIAGRLDLHGLDQGAARARLLAFLLQAQAEGARAVLVITGKGVLGEGVLRRRAPEWLSHPSLRAVVAGLTPADPHHGGEGAYYVALKRRR